MDTATVESLKPLRETIVRELPRWIEEEPRLRQQLVEMLARERISAPRYMTYEEFLEWADEDTLAEWVDGEVIMYSPASRKHQNIADFLTKVMGIFVGQHNLGVVLSAPFQMKLEQSGREPDLLFVAREHLNRLQETHLDGPADVAVEILSPESAGRDRGEKFYEYEAGGVREYWVIDPDRRWAEFYRLGEEGRYRVVFAGEEGAFHSEVLPGFWLRVEWLWQEPLPSALRTLAEIVGMEAQVLAAFERALTGAERA